LSDAELYPARYTGRVSARTEAACLVGGGMRAPGVVQVEQLQRSAHRQHPLQVCFPAHPPPGPDPLSAYRRALLGACEDATLHFGLLTQGLEDEVRYQQRRHRVVLAVAAQVPALACLCHGWQQIPCLVVLERKEQTCVARALSMLVTKRGGCVHAPCRVWVMLATTDSHSSGPVSSICTTSPLASATSASVA
jgi:hypothetical protein